MPPSDRFSDATGLREVFCREGGVLFEKVISVEMLRPFKRLLSDYLVQERQLHRSEDDSNQLACCPWYDMAFLRLLEGELFSLADALLGKDCILYSYNNSCLLPGKGNFSSRPHVERDYLTGDHLETLGMMLLLDNFTADNGATWYLPGSHTQVQAPSQDQFYAQASRLIAPVGSVFLFHPHLWHAGGVNQTVQPRNALLIGFCRPYLKQRFDYPVMFEGRRSELSTTMLQKLGFLARSPASLEAFYSGKSGWNGE